jgi:transcriptional regulator with XRE-family HTH domain
MKGLTQEELAERSGLSVYAISMLERGVRRTPRSSTVEFLAEALKLDQQQRAALAAAARQSAEQRRVAVGTHAL